MVTDYLTKLNFNGGIRKGELLVLVGGRRSGRSMFTPEYRASLMQTPMLEADDFADDGQTLKMTTFKVRKHRNAVAITPLQHKHRSNQTEAYHKKVQKRWDKRSKKETKFQVHRPIVFNMSHDLGMTWRIK